MSRRTRVTPPHTHIALLYWPIILPRYLYEDDDAYDIYYDDDDDANDDDDGVDGDNNGMYFLKTLETWYTDGIACQVISRSSSSFTYPDIMTVSRKERSFHRRNKITIITTPLLWRPKHYSISDSLVWDGNHNSNHTIIRTFVDFRLDFCELLAWNDI